MRRTLTAAAAGLLLVLGVGGVIVFLTGEGLDRAEKWVSISVGVISLLLGAFSAVLAWRSWKQQSPAATPAAGVQVTDSQGVQIGDHGTQHNRFGK
ncbi:hypothetical protein [Actinoplanes sp. GCM10030250]|uniref:hypothetical protein n=1 Tax=Actinoplanes sp. GCM10030250 TaxID=3273376 RepID=UPI00360BC270